MYYYHVTEKRHLPSILDRGLIPQIGDRSQELGETVPAIYCFHSREDCENALENWLGDCFLDVEDDGLCILELNHAEPNLRSDAPFEVAFIQRIPPDSITDIFNESWESILKDTLDVCSFSPVPA